MYGTIRYMNERGAVTIDSEIREVIGLKNKKALVRLFDIEVVKVEDDNLDVDELPNETCRTISKINKRGTVRIDEEVREVLGINGKKAKLRIGNIEVAKFEHNTDDVGCSVDPINIGVCYGRAASSWSRTKDALLRAHPEIKYPLNKSITWNIIASGLLIVLFAAIPLNQNGALEALAARDPIEWAGLFAALAIGAMILILTVPNRKETVRAMVEYSQ